ncbi:RNA polymerase II subunit A C-terminal domain phosphatase SSU72 [Tupaia chinensis]|uniref:RNA polymerase II subunit A C-terminal domain phosphatase SSU72 n=1 Tax=Tupaia chinensis TaxID=246437 RepID=L9KNN9_TUPCH|nr:RNA polymerase II subunit A C-terminal domain phosphatase SSU72 [Tupaia chinensis]
MPLPLRVAVVCSSNQNRSMEAHSILSKRGFSVRSFGTGTHVKLPGAAPDKPNVYDFRTTYDQMYHDLLRKDKELYTQNGLLHMLDRNKRIKAAPERFQSCRDVFDLIVTCEERVYDQVVEELSSREQETCQPVHVVNARGHGERDLRAAAGLRGEERQDLPAHGLLLLSAQAPGRRHPQPLPQLPLVHTSAFLVLVFTCRFSAGGP